MSHERRPLPDDPEPDPDNEECLVHLADRVSPGGQFQFHLVHCPSPHVAAAWIERLQERVHPRGIWVTRLDLTGSPNERFLLDRLIQHLEDNPTPAGMRPAIMVTGAEATLSYDGPRADGEHGMVFIRNANMQRDAFPRHIPGSVALWLDPPAMHAFHWNAPDFTDWNLGFFEFKEPEFLPEPALTILHLSDLQFGKHHRYGRLGYLGPDAALDEAFVPLWDDIAALRVGPDRLRPDLVVVSGDLAEWGRATEFRNAREFLEKLAVHLEVGHDRFVLAPGNHDLNRASCEAYFKECEADEAEPAAPYWPKWKHFHAAFQTFYRDFPQIQFAPELPWTLYEVTDRKLVVAALNSTMAETHREGTHYGWVGERQVRWFEEQLRRYRDRGWFRLGVVHHNVQRGATDDDENLRDADLLAQRLGPLLNLVLHGHTHQSGLFWLPAASPVPALSTGSAALNQQALPPEVPNQYQWLRLHHDRMERWTRCYDPSRRRWIGDSRCSTDGNEWHSTIQLQFQQAQEALPSPDPQPTARAPQSRPDTPAAADDPWGLSGRMSREAQPKRDDFAARVQEICFLRDPRARIEPLRSAEKQIPYLRISQTMGPFQTQYPLGMLEHGVAEEDLEAFFQEVVRPYRSANSETPCQIVYGGSAPTDAVRARAASVGIELLSFAQQQGFLDFRAYRRQLIAELEQDPIYPVDLYIPQRGIYEEDATRHAAGDARDPVRTWLRDDASRFGLVLADFGTGKTFLLRQLALELARDETGPIPLLIPLAELEKEPTWEELLARHLQRRGEKHFDLDALTYYVREGRVALLFDGYDELVLRVTYDRAVDYLDTLLGAAHDRAKVIVTSRRQHFVSTEDVRRILHRRDPVRARQLGFQVERTALHDRAALHPGYRILELQPFDENEIRQFLVQWKCNRTSLGSPKSDPADAERRAREWTRARLSRMRQIQDLVGLAATPRLLSYVAELTDEELDTAAGPGQEVTAGSLYRVLVDRWLAQDSEKPGVASSHDVLQPLERFALLRELAIRFWTRTDRYVEIHELTEVVHRTLPERAERGLTADEAAHQLGGRTLLVQEGASNRRRFVHASFWEWFAAEWLAERIRQADVPDQITRHPITEVMAQYLVDLAGVEATQTWIRCIYGSDTAGETLLKNADLANRRLPEAERIRTNLAGADLRGRDYSGANLAFADLRRANLSGVLLVGVCLDDADLTEANLENADLTGASAQRANLTRAILDRATLIGADLLEATWDGTSLRRTRFAGAKRIPELLESATHGRGATAERPLPCIPLPCGVALSIALGLDGTVFATAHATGKIIVWDTNTGRELFRRAGHEGGVWSVASQDDRLVSGGEDGTVCVWNINTGQQLRRLPGQERNGVRSVALDGNRLASGEFHGTARVWDADTGRELRRLMGHNGRVLSVALLGEKLASGGEDGTVRVWNVESGQELHCLGGHGGSVWGVAWHEELLASGGEDGTVRVWDAESGQELLCCRGHTGAVSTVVWHGERLASGGEDGTVRLWDRESGQELRCLEGHYRRVWSVASQGSRLLSAGSDELVQCWDERSRSLSLLTKSRSQRVWSVAWQGNGLATGGDTGILCLWDVGAGRVSDQLVGRQGVVLCVAWQEGQLASGGTDGTIRLWNRGSGCELRRLAGHDGKVWSVAWHGARLASGGEDGTVRLWDSTTGRELDRLEGHIGPVWSVAWAEGRLASGGEDGTMRIWNVTNGHNSQFSTGHRGRVVTVAWQGESLASGGEDGTVRLWDPASGQKLRDLAGHAGAVWSVAWQGKRLASAGDDGTVRIWDAATGQELHCLEGHCGSVRTVVWNGERCASGGVDGTVRIWDAKNGECLAIFLSDEKGWVAFRPDRSRYQYGGNVEDLFWYVDGLCMFEPGEVDPWVGNIRRLEPGEPLLPPVKGAGDG